MANIDGMKIKFEVLKIDDIKKYLSSAQQVRLNGLLNVIHEKRSNEGKRGSQLSLVINTDEPYADDVISILKENGHWG